MSVAVSAQSGIYLPFRRRELPSMETYLQGTMEWMERVGLESNPRIRRKAAMAGCAAVASWCGKALPAQAMQDFADTLSWFFYCDDVLDRMGADDLSRLTNLAHSLAAIIEQPRSGLLAGLPLAGALVDVMSRVARWFPPGLLHRFQEGGARWVLSTTWEHVLVSGVPGIGAYLALRETSGGVQCCFSVLAAARGTDFSEELNRMPLRVAWSTCSLVMAIDNDIFSRARKLAAREASADIIDALKAEDPSLDEAEAIAKATDYRDRLVKHFLKIRAIHGQGADERTRAFFDMCEDGLVGNVLFSEMSLRYASPDNPYLGREWRSEAETSSDDLPDIPSISWWKDALQA
jgi:hypothetical protein